MDGDRVRWAQARRRTRFAVIYKKPRQRLLRVLRWLYRFNALNYYPTPNVQRGEGLRGRKCRDFWPWRWRILSLLLPQPPRHVSRAHTHARNGHETQA